MATWPALFARRASCALLFKASLPSFVVETHNRKLKGVGQNAPLSMSCHKLPNYLKTYRKRTGFSQDEIAFLLGCKRASHVSRYERFHRTPGFHTLLAFKIIFQASARELFGGEYQKVEKAVCRRAERLAARIGTENPDQSSARKLALLKIIAALPSAAELS